ncbi:MAG: lysine exporter LysO family protein [Dethiosulfatibacter sp.]|nr:lysine exporter LysO family protein [Dethiosulfatibacter sp.]
MFNSVILYLILLVAGALLSYRGLIHIKMLKRVGSLQMFFLYMLIFIMGIRLGMNKEVLKAIGDIGFKAAVFTVGTLATSVAAVYVVSQLLFKGQERKIS